MKKVVVLAGVVVAGMACSQGSQGPIAPSSIGASFTSPAQVGQSTIAVLDSSEGICQYGCPITKYPNYPAEPPSPINYTQGHATQDACTQGYGSGWVTTHLICEEEGTCQPDDPWGPLPTHWCQ